MTNRSIFKKSWLFLSLCCFVLCSLVQGADSITFLEADLASAQDLAAKEDKLLLIYYSADWCMPCKWMEENTFQNLNLVNYTDQNFIAIKADISTANGRVLKEQFEVKILPSILIFASSGKLIDKKSSSLDASQMLSWLQDLDRPQHHLNNTQRLDIVSIQPSLDAPQPDIHFQRPSLIPEDSPAGLITTLEKEHTNATQPILAAVTHSKFTPRSSLRYGIKLTDKKFNYETGIKEVAFLENKFDQSAELIPEINHHLSVVIGHFETTGQAREFLIFLNRNNRTGEIITISR